MIRGTSAGIGEIKRNLLHHRSLQETPNFHQNDKPVVSLLSLAESNVFQNRKINALLA